MCGFFICKIHYAIHYSFSEDLELSSPSSIIRSSPGFENMKNNNKHEGSLLPDPHPPRETEAKCEMNLRDASKYPLFSPLVFLFSFLAIWRLHSTRGPRKMHLAFLFVQ